MSEGGVAHTVILCIVILLLVIILGILVIYILLLKYRETFREHDVECQRCPHQHSAQHLSGIVSSLMNFPRHRSAWSHTINPAYVPDDDDDDDVKSMKPNEINSPFQDEQVGTCCTDTVSDEEVNVVNNAEVLSPSNCLSGRYDIQLSELRLRNMKESKTSKVDSKLVVFISREIDHMGGHLVLDKMGISLFVPPCAIPQGQKEVIQLVLDWDLSDFPSMEPSQTIISPVVHCGPHGLRLSKPAVLSFMHCAEDVQDIVVMSSETHLTHPKDWRPISRRKKRGGKNKYDLLANQCQIYLSHFSLYTCLAEGTETRKWIQLVAFGGKQTDGGLFQVFVYMLNNTPCALQFATQQQAEYDSVPLRCPLEFLFDALGGDLIFKLSHLGVGWTCEGNKVEERGLFPDIWQGKCNSVSFVFKHENPSVNDINFNIDVFQKDKEHEKRSMQIMKEMPKPRRPQDIRHFRHSTTNVNVFAHDSRHHLPREGLDSGIHSETTSSKSVVIERYHKEPGSRLNDTKDGAESCDDFQDFREIDRFSLRNFGDESHELDDEERSTTSDGPTEQDDARYSSCMQKQTGPSHSSPAQIININVTPRVQPPPNPVDVLPNSGDQSCRFFPHSLRVELGRLLDPPNLLGNDWRALAESLGIDSRINWLETLPSPTYRLLDVAQQQGFDFNWLVDVLSAVSRVDAAEVARRYCVSDCASDDCIEHTNAIHHMEATA
ncbi:netrin receptor UNC5C-like [Diadema antillarum]|uniref:netrin receptor UNC5C-like n=1 Tax=Diadema antillarum TaxID=105358 RepID=UPI003A87B467